MDKIEAIKKTIDDLVSGETFYHWHDSDHCNCGVIAKTLLNGVLPFDAGYFDSPIYEGDGCFSRHAFCITTNLPLPKVFQSLKDAGFTHQELLELEYLSNEKILFKTDISIDTRYYQNKKNLIKYLTAWLEILQEEQQPKTKVIIRYVSVPVSLIAHQKECEGRN